MQVGWVQFSSVRIYTSKEEWVADVALHCVPDDTPYSWIPGTSLPVTDLVYHFRSCHFYTRQWPAGQVNLPYKSWGNLDNLNGDLHLSMPRLLS